MKKLLQSILVTSALTASSTYAGDIAYSGAFGQPNGSNITTINNWSGPSDYEVNGSGSLSYTDSFGNELVTTGNSVRDLSSGGASNQLATYDFPDQAGGTDFYVSFLLNNGAATSNRVLLNPTTGSGGDIFIIDNSGGNFRFRTTGGGVGTTEVTTSSPFANTQNFIIFKIDSTFGSGGTLHQIDFWLNPTDLSNIGSPTGTIANLASLSPELIGYESISFDSGSSAATGTAFDELRIGTSLASVTPFTAVPEPSAYALISGALAFGWIMVRRRK